MVRFTALILTFLVGAGSLFGLVCRVGGGSALPTDDPDILRRIQEDHLASRGTHVMDLAEAVRSHLGLAPARLEDPGADCTLAHGERDDRSPETAMQDPEAALASLVDELEANGPADVAASLAFLTARGGAIVWAPDRLEGTGWLALQTTRNLWVGEEWLTAAIAEPSSVHANLQHEVGGHLFYGHSLACRIVEAALVDDDDVDRWKLFHTLAYPESEIYAELKELPHYGKGSLGDEPAADIADQVAQIRAGFPAAVAEALLDSMDARFAVDATLTSDALELFRAIVG